MDKSDERDKNKINNIFVRKLFYIKDIIMIFKKIWYIWEKIGFFIANLIGFIISIVLYISIITPFGIIIRVTTDYLNIKNKKETMWIEKKPRDLTLGDMRRQY